MRNKDETDREYQGRKNGNECEVKSESDGTIIDIQIVKEPCR